MKTLCWTGAVCDSPIHGQAAIWRWWYYYQTHRKALGVTHWAVFNNGQRNHPVEFIVKLQCSDGPMSALSPDFLNFIYHPEALPRRSVLHNPGFFRNLLTCLRVCQEQEFDRFILIEYDCMILSADMLYEVGGTATGLTAYWCPHYDIPETGIVICGKDRYQRTIEQAQALLALDNPTEADRFEVAMDWTEVRKRRRGDRYPEFTRNLPADVEYVCQMPIHARINFEREIEVIE